jgi:hypothetical protein
MNRNRRSITGSISGAVVLIGLALAFAFGGFNLPIFFVALAFAALIGSLSTMNPKSAYGGIQGFVWLLGLAFCFAVGWWPWILVVCAASLVVGALIQPIMGWLIGLGIAGAQPTFGQQPQQYYQPPQQPPLQNYQEGYQQSAQPEGTYQEGGKQYPYSSPSQPPAQGYEEPQAQYPQQMPPQQQ